MKTTTHFLSVALGLAVQCSAQVICWDIEKHSTKGATLQRRSQVANNSFEEIILNEKGRGGYFATVSIGSPAQNFTMQLDTASSDLWVPYSGASICESTSDTCTYGTYDPQDSTTFNKIADNGFHISYADGRYASGDYFKDSFAMAGATVKNLVMGLGLQTTIPFGLIGLGYPNNEASVTNGGKSYANLPLVMQQQGLIKSTAYSLWLNDLDANTGNIIFGGIDTGKFDGPLKKIAVVPDADNDYTYFTVPLTSLEATSPSGTDIVPVSDGSLDVILDSGSTLTYLPTEMATTIWKEVGAVYQTRLRMAVLPCSHTYHPGYFSFGFSGSNGPRINITMDELVVDLTDGSPPTITSGPYKGERLCEFGIQNTSTTPYVLGDTFLRSAYVVYDLENHEIGLATTRFNSTETTIVPFESQGAPIPSASPVTGSSSTNSGTSMASSSTISASSTPQTTNLMAASGFQDGDVLKEDGAFPLPTFSWPGLFVLGLSGLMAL